MTFTQPLTDTADRALSQVISQVIKINFQPDSAPVPSSYIKDIGEGYSASRGFGWVRQESLGEATIIPLDIRSKARDRQRAGIDPRLNTFLHMQHPSAGFDNPDENRAAAWQCDLPNGTYRVTVSVGDRPPYDSQHTIRVQGVTLIDRFQSAALQEYRSATALVEVANGTLTIDAIGGRNTKINYIEIVIAGSNPSAAGPVIEVENLDGVPFPDRLIFNRIGSLTNPPANRVHDRATLRVKNTGNAELTITELTIQGAWILDPVLALPVTIAPATHRDLSLQFQASRGNVHTGALMMTSNAVNASQQLVQLGGFWQRVSEGGQEPSLNEIIQVCGYQTTITKTGQKLNRRGKVEAVGDEILSAFWQPADPAKPVHVRQLAAYHTQGSTATVRWHQKGSNMLMHLFTHAGADGQSLLPYRNDSTLKPAEGTFHPNGPFGFKIDNEWSDPEKNRRMNDEGHHVRFWPAIDRNGQLMVNTWIMAMDYSGINYDYNDNVYLVTNMQPTY